MEPHRVGANDGLGNETVECVHRVRDFRVTPLYLLALDNSRLTYFHEGRYKQLGQTGGQVIQKLLGSMGNLLFRHIAAVRRYLRFAS
jgi:hypothetical protein